MSRTPTKTVRPLSLTARHRKESRARRLPREEFSLSSRGRLRPKASQLPTSDQPKSEGITSTRDDLSRRARSIATDSTRLSTEAGTLHVLDCDRPAHLASGARTFGRYC